MLCQSIRRNEPHARLINRKSNRVIGLLTRRQLSRAPARELVMKTDKVHQGKFTVILRKEEGGNSVRCVELPGAISEGKTRREALANIREAIQGYLEAFPEEESRLKVRNEVVQLAI